ncbi:hypothetical protein ACOI1C_21785 [Bacillus sp. DJP31]|uniref:hypothetical protein n=1 Tax=Bacillus sp. DJP31 TaxID=3409789 RepID=UPI003BB667A7
MSRSLVDEGWSKVNQSGNWHVLMIEKSQEQMKISSVREGIIKCNLMISYIFIGINLFIMYCCH